MHRRRVPRLELKRAALKVVRRGFRSLLPTALGLDAIEVLTFLDALGTGDFESAPERVPISAG
jgi:hypothetical protein